VVERVINPLWPTGILERVENYNDVFRLIHIPDSLDDRPVECQLTSTAIP
jgi:hypothetical protein